MKKPRMTAKRLEEIRLAILKQAEDLGVPAFMTPLWQERWGVKR